MLENLSGRTRLFPIIGEPIIYVRAVNAFTREFERRGHDGICIPLQVSGADFAQVMPGLAKIGNVDGVLVTTPHKFTAFPYCATSTERARMLGVVSAMRRNPDGSWHGDMLDGLSFVKSQQDQGATHQGARVLLLGAGGAGSATAIELLAAGVRELIIHDIDPGRTDKLLSLLASRADGRVRAGGADPSGCDIVCNATTMGMADGDPLPLDASLLKPSMFVADVVAGHGLTPLLAAARAAGCRTSNGDQMVDAVQAMMLDFLLGK